MEELRNYTEPTPYGPSLMNSGVDSEDHCADSGYSKRRIDNVLDESCSYLFREVFIAGSFEPGYIGSRRCPRVVVYPSG